MKCWKQNDGTLQSRIIYSNSKQELQHRMGISMHEIHEHTMFMHHWREVCKGAGRDEDSPATIYLIWLSWLHCRRPDLWDTEAGTGRGSDTGKHGSAVWLPCLPFHTSTNWTWQLDKKYIHTHSLHRGLAKQSLAVTSALPFWVVCKRNCDR